MVQRNFKIPSEPSPNSIKLLDLLTNRYHVGVVRESSDEQMCVDVPAGTHFHAGQRVRFVVAGEALNGGVVRRHLMHRAFVTNVLSSRQDQLRIQLAITG
jgi:hypothetical protein